MVACTSIILNFGVYICREGVGMCELTLNPGGYGKLNMICIFYFMHFQQASQNHAQNQQSHRRWLPLLRSIWKIPQPLKDKHSNWTVSLQVYIYTVFILIEAQHASAWISLSETVLISGENNYCDRNTIYPFLIYYKFSLLYDLLKQVCTKCNIFNCKVKQFQWFCHRHIAVKNGACFN